MKRMNKQKGFTIIELVVVILLLGILTATALPRFMDVTDEAHQAVVDGVETGLVTSAALFSAQWYAEGQPLDNPVDGYGGSLYANTNGFIEGLTDDFETTGDESDCQEIYEELLQSTGRPSFETEAFTTDAETTVEAATGADFVITTDAALGSATQCIFYYTGQYAEGDTTDSHTIQSIIYTPSSGAWTEGTLDLDS